jgi:flagellar basal body rod protein FlgG
VLHSGQYHIDRFGYLLDHDNRYIVDTKGNQIKLEEKHLKLLEQHQVFQR